jgi:hypothetical protein
MDEFGNYVGRNVKIPTYEAPRGMYGLRAQEIKPSSYAIPSPIRVQQKVEKPGE